MEQQQEQDQQQPLNQTEPDGLLPYLYDISRQVSLVPQVSTSGATSLSNGPYLSLNYDLGGIEGQDEEDEDENEEVDEEERQRRRYIHRKRIRRDRHGDEYDNDEERSLLEDNTTYRRQHRSLFFRFINIIDAFLSIVIFSPLVSIFWYCTWSFLDDYLLTFDQKLSNLVCWLSGLLILLPSYVFQKDLQDIYLVLLNCNSKFFQCLAVLMRVIYIYLVTLAVILEWRGVWNLFDLYFFNDWQTQISLAILALTFFCLTKTSRTLVATPFFLYMDDYHHFFTTEHKHQSDEFSYLEFSVDFLLTEIVECIALVAAWRGAENSFDQFVYPNDIVKKLGVSFTSSHSIYLFVAVIQHTVFRRFSKSTLIARLIAEDFMYIVMFLSSVFSWKFYWDVMDLVVIKALNGIVNELYFYLAAHALTFLVALGLKVSAILVGPGTSFLDGTSQETDLDSYFQVNYLTTIYMHRIEREEAENILEPSTIRPSIS